MIKWQIRIPIPPNMLKSLTGDILHFNIKAMFHFKSKVLESTLFCMM